jgi:hypothetical protein
VQDHNLGSRRIPPESVGGPLTGPQTAVKLFAVKAPLPYSRYATAVTAARRSCLVTSERM